MPTVFMIVACAALGVIGLGIWQGGANQTPGRPALSLAASATNTPAPATATPAPTATALPTATPPPPVTPTPEPTPTAPDPPQMQLAGLRHEWQTWNNCGPATLSMLLSYYGSSLDQATAGAALRLSPDDKNVSPEELVAYAQAQGYEARLLVGGDPALARTLVARGIPVLVETWHEDESGKGLGHYRLLTGYDDALQSWIVYDSLDYSGLISAEPYQGLRMPYEKLDRLWKVFNRTLLLAYPNARAGEVEAILAAHGLSEQTMWQVAQRQAEGEISADPNDLFAWFNLGSSLTAQGDFAGAAEAFDRATAIGLPERMLWYQFSPFEAYLAVGRAQEEVGLADAVLATADSVEEVHYWRGRGLALLGDTAAARAAYEQALVLNPAYLPAQQALEG
ncbi:MAG: C39 family peptidase [Anaerolineales bacterium]|nr:C39 family peptidase [Anaerolineales bacterium]